MKWLRRLLVGAILVQAGVLLAPHLGWSGGGAPQDGRLLPEVVGGDTSSLLVEGGGRTIFLRRVGAGWVVLGSEDRLADEELIDDAVRDLGALTEAWPVRHGFQRRGELHVDDEIFDRRLTVQTTRGDVALLVGQPAEGEETYLRRRGERVVYATRDLTLYQLPTSPGAWSGEDTESPSAGDRPAPGEDP